MADNVTSYPKNIIFNNFLKLKLESDLDLTTPYTYKICLLKSSFYALYSKSGFINTLNTYAFISIAGFECEDINYNYKSGGKDVTLSLNTENSNTSMLQKYYIKNSPIEWKNVKFKDYNLDPLKYILLYRISDGLLIACFDISDSFKYTPNDNGEINIKLNWDVTTPLFTIEYSNFNSAGMTLDSNFDLNSSNPIQNSTVTKALLKYGISLGEEKPKNPDLPDEYTDGENSVKLDRLTRITNTEDIVNDIFKENSESTEVSDNNSII